VHAVPPRVSGREVDNTGMYRCPLCQSQGTGDEEDIGWVACPMLRSEMICLGCCLDHQGLARSSNFEEHAFRGLFESLSSKTGVPIVKLRRLCLQHQESIVDEEVGHGCTNADALAELRAAVVGARTLLDLKQA